MVKPEVKVFWQSRHCPSVGVGEPLGDEVGVGLTEEVGVGTPDALQMLKQGALLVFGIVMGPLKLTDALALGCATGGPVGCVS